MKKELHPDIFPVRFICFDSKVKGYPYIALEYNPFCNNESVAYYENEDVCKRELIIELPEESIKLSNNISIEQLEKLKNYTQQIMDVNQHVIDDLNSMVRELKEICKLPEQKPQFKRFDKVLVRNPDDEYDKWTCDIFSHMNGSEYVLLSGIYENYEVIPYEGNEYLVGTTDKP